jgi:hypothetical protein
MKATIPGTLASYVAARSTVADLRAPMTRIERGAAQPTTSEQTERKIPTS